MPTTVDVPEVGTIEFPDSMDQEQIKAAIKRKFYGQSGQVSPSLPLSEVMRKKESVMVQTPETGFWTTPVTGPPRLIRHPQTVAEGIANVTARTAGQMLTPLAAATAPLSTLAIARPIIAGTLAGLGAKGAGEAAGELSVPQDRTPGETAEKVGDLAVNLTMAAGAPLTALAVKEAGVTPGKGTSALQRETTKVLQPVRPQPEQGPRQVPAKGPSPEAGARGQPPVSEKAQALTPEQEIEEQARLAAELGQEQVTAATYTNPKTGETTTAPNHPEAAAKQGVEAPTERTARETPEYGFEVTKPSGEKEVVTREEAQKVAEKSGQLLKPPETGKVHSDEIASPVQPATPLGDVPQSDFEKYNDLADQFKKAVSEKDFDRAFNIQKGIEEIKGRHGGLPPKEELASEIPELVEADVKNDPRLDEPGVTRVAKPNSIIVQLRDLDSNPVREVVLPSSGDPLADSKEVQRIIQAEADSKTISQRESMAISTGPNGRGVYHFAMSPSGMAWTAVEALQKVRGEILPEDVPPVEFDIDTAQGETLDDPTARFADINGSGSYAVRRKNKDGEWVFDRYLPDGTKLKGVAWDLAQAADDLNKAMDVEPGRGAISSKLQKFRREEAEKLQAQAGQFRKGIEEGTRQRLRSQSEGPGAASPGDVPAAAPQSVAAGSKIEQAPPESRPLGPASPIGIGLVKMREAINNIGTVLKGMAGESMPKTTAVNREVGEAGVRYASSRIAAKPKAATFAAQALEGTNVDPVKFGAALTEDNLRSIRESLRQQATELRAKGDAEGSEQATEEADRVSTIIGSKGSPFKTEDEYFDFLEHPDTKRAIAQHIQLWQEVIDPQYRQARSLDPDVELPSRGQQTGARINLHAVFPEEGPVRPVSGVGAPSLTATFKRKTPFAIKAKGTGETYDIDYGSIIANTFERQLEIANKNHFDKMLVESGNAKIAPPGKQVTIQGERTVPFPLERRLIVSDTRSFPKGQNIYVRASLANEYRSASNVDQNWNIPFVTKTMNFLNKMALAGLTDATVHFSNQMTALFNRPVSSKLFSDSLLSATGRADIPVTLVKATVKAFQNNQKQIAELAEIGALRPQQGKTWGMGKLLRKTDQISRLMLDDTFKSLAEQGLFDKTETARREYVNQIGQYNRRLQGPLLRLFRETGFGPFATAGRTFNALGVKMVSLSPGAKGANAFAEVALRANVLSKWIGAAVLIGSLNYLLTKDKGGGVMGRPGTPVGSVDFGTNDRSGKQLSLPLLSVLGLGRGLRVTGIKGAVESGRLGLTDMDMLQSAARDVINSSVSPYAGPGIRAGFITASGYPPAVSVGRSSRVAAPGESQLGANFKEAMIEANPVVQSAVKAYQGKPVHEVLAGQLPRFTLIPGKTEPLVKHYPRIVSMAQGNAFIEDSIYQARRLPKDERRKFLVEQFKRLPANQREHAWNEVQRRHALQ